MEITDIRVRLLNTDNRLKAVVSIVIDDAFAVHELRVIEGREGVFVAMPSKQIPDGTHRDIAHPITLEAREKIEKVVLEAYQKAIQTSGE